MKGLTLATITLIVLTIAVSGCGIIIDAQLGQIEKAVTVCTDTKEAMTSVYQAFRSREWIFSICVADGLLYNLETAFTEWITSGENERNATKSRLIQEINHIKRLNGFNLKAIL